MADFILLVLAAFASVAAALVYAVITRGKPSYRAARVLSWICGLGFWSLGIVFAITHDTPSLWVRLVVAAIVGAVAAGGLAWVISDIETQQRSSVGPKADESSKQKTIYELFKSDFTNFFALGQDLTIIYAHNNSPQQKLTYKMNMQIYQDFNNKSSFLGYYLTPSPDTFFLCMQIAANFSDQMNNLNKGILMQARNPGEPATASNDLTFSGRIFIYHETEMSVEQIGLLTTAFRNRGAAVVFRGRDYATTKWFQDELKRKQPKS